MPEGPKGPWAWAYWLLCCLGLAPFLLCLGEGDLGAACGLVLVFFALAFLLLRNHER